MAISSAVDCPSLISSGLELSTTNVTEGTVVHLSCDDFGHKPSGGVRVVICLSNGNWSQPIPKCEWSWDFTTEEKIIFGTSVAAVSFVIVVVIAIIIAYHCCYKKRKDKEEKLYNASYNSSSASPQGYDGPYNERDSYPVTYLAYQDGPDRKHEVYANADTIDKPWLGYIPRPKVSEGPFYT
ncbi:hypothetical protein PoB_007514700 [Plakobranchus ocellatus]|uniref:Sushi domain-containing protein n=1 Tax=Plakobranchus ocellatus TaxID=259542 RepID=A0AAV4DWH5_9GAST|nr:hypothetical protein PoB_007514700 [Plakobranchus ocellatus]